MESELPVAITTKAYDATNNIGIATLVATIQWSPPQYLHRFDRPVIIGHIMPAEGEKYYNQTFVAKLDSTEPGTTQRLIDFTPAILVVSCDPEDNFGTLRLDGDCNLVTVRRLSKEYDSVDEGEEVGNIDELVFSGDEQLVARLNSKATKQVIILRHRHGDPEEPPYRKERVPRQPEDPRDELQAAVALEIETPLLVAGRK